MSGATYGTIATIGLLVPCRNEALVIQRKIENLARVRWPAGASGVHRIVVVDDGSSDGTAEVARLALEECCGESEDSAAAERPRNSVLASGRSAPKQERSLGVEGEVLLNDVRAGKSGAIAAGLARLAGLVDLVVLSDADVVIDPGALEALERAFAREPELVLASGAQRIVRDLDSRGYARGAGGGRLVSRAGIYARLSECVRRVESSLGKMVSVHGQLLAWRASAGLAPTPGLAADDLDLALQVRARGGRVRRIAGARFFEEKVEDRARAQAQALRRARAYVQLLGARRLDLGTSRLDRLQAWFYARVPLAAPELAAALFALVPWAGALAGGVGGAALATACEGAFLSSPVGLSALRFLRVIRSARMAERKETLSDRWEMRRA